MWSYWLAPVASTKPRTGAQRQGNPELRGGEGGLAVVAALILAAVVQRLMLHAAVILDRAKRRSGQLKPFARGPHGIAARRALAFEHPGFLLLRRGRLPIGVETGMGEGANGVQDRRDGRTKRLAGGGGAHRPDEPQPPRAPFKRFPMPCRDADGGMDQLMREAGRDLRRPGVRRAREAGPDEDFKLP